jgi:hypothetical protein
MKRKIKIKKKKINKKTEIFNKKKKKIKNLIIVTKINNSLKVNQYIKNK